MKRPLLATTLLTIAGSAYAQIAPGSGPLTDASGNKWLITASGSIQENGKWTPGGGGTSALLISNGTVYGQDAGGRGWFALSADNQAWTSTPAPVAAALVASAVPDPAASLAPCQTARSGSGTGAFRVANGQIVAPDGKPFIARGINVYDSQMGDAAQILATFPGVNFIRLAVYGYQSAGAYRAFINTMTEHGTVVELENHQTSDGSNAGGGSGVVFTGTALADELAWYRAVAVAYEGNPYVWFGTNNEPPENPSAAALSTWQQQTYQAIRSTENNNPIMVEMNCDANGCGAGYVPSVYAGMVNIVWDMHFYNWLAGYASDQPTIAAVLKANGASAQQIPSGDGVVPVLIGEYGNSTNGTTLDAGGVETVAAVINIGATGRFGSAAWEWRAGVEDNLVDGGGSITAPFGQQVQLFLNTSPVPLSACEVTQQATKAIAAIEARADITLPPTDQPATPDATPPAPVVDPAIAAANAAALSDIDHADAIIAHARAVLQGNIGRGPAQ